MMPRVTVYSVGMCQNCKNAKELLHNRGAEIIDEIRIDLHPTKIADMMAAAGGLRSVPQIFIGDQHVGGLDALIALDAAGRLVSMLNGGES